MVIMMSTGQGTYSKLCASHKRIPLEIFQKTITSTFKVELFHPESDKYMELPAS